MPLPPTGRVSCDRVGVELTGERVAELRFSYRCAWQVERRGD